MVWEILSRAWRYGCDVLGDMYACMGAYKAKLADACVCEMQPVLVFDLGSPVGDVAWSPHAATTFAAATEEGKVLNPPYFRTCTCGSLSDQSLHEAAVWIPLTAMLCLFLLQPACA